MHCVLTFVIAASSASLDRSEYDGIGIFALFFRRRSLIFGLHCAACSTYCTVQSECHKEATFPAIEPPGMSENKQFSHTNHWTSSIVRYISNFPVIDYPDVSSCLCAC